MGVGLNLSGLKGLSTTQTSLYEVQLNALGNSTYSVTNAVLKQSGTDPNPIFLRISSSTNSASVYPAAGLGSFGGLAVGTSVVGWNANGLIFNDAGAAGYYWVFATSSGEFGNGNGIPVGTIFNKSADDIPFADQGLTAACFAEGTAISTPAGEVAIEDLRAGDMAITVSGAVRPIAWIGQSTVRPRKHPRPHEVNPVRIRKGAFGEGLPVRDLVLSPGHAVFVEGVLIPVGHLVNGATIVQEEVERIRYFHVELDSHDVLLAAGLPCETYLDDGNRATFANAGESVELFGRLDPKSWDDACAPMVAAGPQLTEVQLRLLARAG